MIVVLAAPVINACNGDARGLLSCVRGLIDDRFDLGLEPTSVAPEQAMSPATGETPAPEQDLQLADAVVPKPAMEPTRSLVAPAPDKPLAPPATPPQIVPGRIAAVPDTTEPEPLAIEPVDPAPAAALTPDVDPVPAEAPPVVLQPDGFPLPPAPDQPAPADAEPDLPPVTPMPEAAPQVSAEQLPTETADLPGEEALPEPAPVEADPPAAQVLETEAPPVAPEDLPAAVPASGPEPAEAEPVPVEEAGPEPEPQASVAAIEPAVPEVPEPEATILVPTIDAIEIDRDRDFVAGNGPDGATMRLYVDGLPAGVSVVEGGRWLVEGTDLLTDGRQVLEVEALDPLTGRILGATSIVFEGPVVPSEYEAAAPTPEAPPAEPVSDPPSAELPEDPPTLTDSLPPAALPPIAPVVPAGETPSVTILKPAADPAIETLPRTERDEGSVLSLGSLPQAPAIAANLTIPEAETGVLRAVPIGDPGAGRFVSGKAIIRRGDTLWDIAHRFYGRGVHYRTIYRANRELIGRPGRIYPGQVIELPLVYDD
jgi:nucleoid-associated protein YgaU